MVHTIMRSGKGLTAIELLIMISIFAVIVIFAAPRFSNSNSEFVQAIKITESTVDQARKTARYYRTDVLMQLETDEQRSQQSLTLSIPKMQSNEVLNEVEEKFPLPPGIQVINEGGAIRFDQKGELETPAQLLFVSERQEDESHQLVIR